jgi:hypothetical protein
MGVEQEVKKMAKVAIQSALPGDKVLNDVVVRTIGDINKTVGDISSTIEIHSEMRNNAVYAAGVLNNLVSWQQKVDARLDELHNVAMGLQQKLGWVLDILRTFPAQAHGINAPPGMAGPYGYMQQWGPPMGAPNYAPSPGGPGFATQPFGANMNPAPEMAPSAPSQPTPPPEPNPVAVAVALGKQPEAATSTPPVEAGPNIKSQPVSKKLEDYPDDQLLMVKSNSFSVTHPDLNEVKNKLVEAGMAKFKVASTDVAWWHRIGESGKPTGSWAACFSDPAKHTNFWDMAMARANELANFNIVVEKWDSSKIGGKRGGSKGKPEGPRVTRQQERAHPTHGLPLKTRRAQSRIRLRACQLPLRRLFFRH